MRARHLAALGAVATLWLILYLRHHITELGEILLTYSTFYPLLHRYPDLLYRYQPTAPSSTPSSSKSQVVPKIINSIALGNSSLFKYQAAIHSCTSLHPDWEHRIWTDVNATAFIAEHYPLILPHYTGYAQNIQRANILRYALLHKSGGVYVDLDVTCRVALDTTPLVRLPFVSPGAHPAGVNNAFIAAQPGHPFLAQLLEAVPSHDLHWGLPMRIPYVENMLSTGCMYYSNQWMSYVRGLVAGRNDQRVYILSDENGNMDPHMLRGKVTTPIFVHGGASSWHGWDAAMFLMIGEHWLLYLTILLVVLGLAVGLPICLCTGSRRRMQFRRRCWFWGGSNRNSWSPTRRTRERKPSISESRV